MEEWFEYEYAFNVRFRDTDAYAVVHHSNYFCYFEEARYSFAREMLKSYEDISDFNNMKFPVIEASCRYIKALSYQANDYYIYLKFRMMNISKFEFIYEIRSRKKSGVFAAGRTVHVMLNENNKLCLTIPKRIADKLKAMNELQNK